MGTLSINKLEENYIFTGCLCGIYGILFTFCLYRNLSGITFPFIVAGTILTTVLFLKRMGSTIKKKFMIYAAGMMLLGISTVLTGSVFFHFFNWVGILLLLLTSMLEQLNIDSKWSFQHYIVSIMALTGRTVISIFDPFIHGARYRKSRKQGKENAYLKPVLLGAGVAVTILLVVLPLLIYSDKVFGTILMKFFRPVEFGSEWGIIFTFFLGFILMYAFLSGISGYVSKEKTYIEKKKVNAVSGITFTGILAAIYVFYSVIQILFLFLRLDSGLPDGVTYSQYANSGFWQLLAVSLINFVTVLICLSIFPENKILKILLMTISVCTCIMTLSAAYRMILYVRVYYLTFLRILVLWFLGVLLLIMLGVMWSILRRQFRLFQYIMAVVAVCYIGLSFAKIDKVSVEYNLSQWEEVPQVDIVHAIYGSSLDAAPYLAEMGERAVETAVETEPASGEYDYKSLITSYYQDILDRKMTLRSWNYSLAEAKKAAAEYMKNPL